MGIVNRRRVMAGIEEDKRFKLLYEWNSDDALIDGVWYDRVQNLPLTATNPYKINGMYYVNCIDAKHPQNYFSMDMNENGLKLPYRWRVKVTYLLPEGKYGYDSMLVDFGSLAGSTHAFGVMLNGVNYKPFDNNAAKYGLNKPAPYIYNRVVTCAVGVEAYDADNDILYYCPDVKLPNTIYYGIAPHRHTLYDGNWNQKDMYVGRGNSLWGSCHYEAYIKSIKIYEDLEIKL